MGTITLAAACSDSETARIKATSRATYDQATGKLTEITYDQNKNGKIDTWLQMDGTRAIMAKIDTNDDGAIDRWEYYGDHGQLVKVGWLRSVSPNGVDASAHAPKGFRPSNVPSSDIPKAPTGTSPDAFAYFRPDGSLDHAEYLETSNVTGKQGVVRREFYDAGKMTRAEEDTDGDGIMDRWEYYINGLLRAVELDDQRPYDGKPDRRMSYDEKGSLMLVETQPDGRGNYAIKTVPGIKN